MTRSDSDSGSDSDRANQFWSWALGQYESAALRTLLLEAQDAHGLIVLELLLAAWLAAEGHPYTATHRAAVLAAAMPWELSVVRPLRAGRRAWREQPALAPARERLQRLELQAEREMADLMVAALPGLSTVSSPPTVTRNLHTVQAEVPAATTLLTAIAEAFDDNSSAHPG